MRILHFKNNERGLFNGCKCEYWVIKLISKLPKHFKVIWKKVFLYKSNIYATIKIIIQILPYDFVVEKNNIQKENKNKLDLI